MSKKPKEYFVDKLEGQIRELEENIDNLELKMEDADWEPIIDFKKQVDNLRIRLDDIKKEMEQWKVAPDSHWKDIKEQSTRSLNTLRKDVKKAFTRLDQILLG